MRKLIKPLTLILVIGLLSYLGYSVASKIKYKNEVITTLETIPEFSFKTLENYDYTNTNLKLNIPTLFIYFNTECDYCQHEAETISENLEQFKNTQLLFVSTESKSTIKQFSEHYNLHNQSNITFLHDNTHSFSNRFDANAMPYVLIYDKHQKLIKKHKGQLKAETMLKLLKE